MSTRSTEPLHFMWLEVTGACQLTCAHCYADSGPGGSHGSMTPADWLTVITDAATAGVEMVQFIGGEPTLHPALPALMRHALAQGMRVEVFSNLVNVSELIWATFELPGVSLATSYYSGSAVDHEDITGGRNSFGKTRGNIAEALRRGVPLRVGIIGVHDEQDVQSARADLRALGVPDEVIGLDYVREVGRGQRASYTATVNQLCGKCGDGVAAVMPDGRMQPCVFSRQAEFTVGDLSRQSLSEVVSSPRLRDVRGVLSQAFVTRGLLEPLACGPHNCHPHCWPSCGPNCAPSCSPSCAPTHSCRPYVGPPY